MNTVRLLQLADFLDKVIQKERPNDFNFSCYVDWCSIRTTASFTGELACGTPACAIGFCPMVPEFKEFGLRYDLSTSQVVGNFTYSTDLVHGTTGLTARLLFEITNEVMRGIFFPRVYLYWGPDDIVTTSPDEDATAVEVAAHIRDVVQHFEQYGSPRAYW